ncbi:MAG: hypothetical protein M1823_003916 [Watsoniomyces obsoletus]|nr:MAG: hypothetical protein M1823_003916 [Watsoniomyces obsoletus]
MEVVPRLRPSPSRSSRHASPSPRSLSKGARQTPSRRRAPSPSDSNRANRSRHLGTLRRWDGISRTTFKWPGPRKDSDLWDSQGDCFVYLHGPGESDQHASFRLSFDVIQAAECDPLLERFAMWTSSALPRRVESAASFDSLSTIDGANLLYYHIYIPAPSHWSPKQIEQYHLDTRNFFAWMFCKPIVGTNLGQALVSLAERMGIYRSAPQERNVEDILDYIDEQAYADFRECPDHALGVLLFAEHHRLQDVWTDAFVHCVGMNDRLLSSPGFEPVSRASKALIMTARLEMDVRLERAERQLNNFLDDELSSSRVGLGEGARAHLDRFRSFLHTFFVAKFGYWPPQAHDRVNKSSFSKQTYHHMYVDFRSLYEYLVDRESTTSIERNKPPTGGLCVLQNVLAFDERNGYTSLEHPLPLLPETEVMSDSDQPRRPFNVMKSLGWSLGKTSKSEKRMAILDALFSASNTENPSTMSRPLVQAYMDFEEDVTLKQEDRVSAVDARKVRWILVYALLQTLISVTRVPPEVRDAGADVSYHLCCRIGGSPPWKVSSGSKEDEEEETPSIETPESSPSRQESIRIIDFRPDNADFISRRMSAYSSLNTSPIGSSTHLSSLIHHHNNTEPPRPKTQPEPHRQVSNNTAVTRTASNRRTSRFCEIVVWGYGNGLNAAAVAVSSSSPSSSNNNDNQSKPQPQEQDHEQDTDHLSLPTLSVRRTRTPSPRSPSPTPSPSSHAIPSRSPSSSSSVKAPGIVTTSSTSISLVVDPNDDNKEREKSEGGCSRSTSSATATTSTSTSTSTTTITTSSTSVELPTMDHLSVMLEGKDRRRLSDTRKSGTEAYAGNDSGK